MILAEVREQALADEGAVTRPPDAWLVQSFSAATQLTTTVIGEVLLVGVLIRNRCPSDQRRPHRVIVDLTVLF